MYILTYRFSMFGDYKRFSPTTENVIQWTQMFKDNGFEFLPNIIAQQVSPIPLVPTLPPQPDNRIQFSSPAGDLFVRVLSERVDVEHTSIETDTPVEELRNKFGVLEVLIRTMLGALENEKGTRLAYYVDGFMPEKEDGAFNGIYSSNNVGITIKNAEDCVEWRHRFNSHIKIDAGSGEELCNSIILLEAAALNAQNSDNGEISAIKGLHFSADINTVAERNARRFIPDDLIRFCSQAQELYFNVYTQLSEFTK